MRIAFWVLAASITVPAAAQEVKSIPRMLEVDGSGETIYIPTAATITVNADVQNDDPGVAARKVAAIISRAIGALHQAGVADSSITAGWLSTNRQQRVGDKDTAPAYIAAQTIKIDVRELSGLARLADLVARAGANNWNVIFYAPDFAGLEAKTRQAALANAIAIADEYGQVGGFRRGKILKMIESANQFPSIDQFNGAYEMVAEAQNSFRPPLVAAPMATLSRSASPQIQAEQDFTIPRPEPQSLSASVHVLFEIN